MNHRFYRSGFTIVELLIVIVVIAILAAITIVSYNGITKRAGEAVLQSDLHTAAVQLELDKTDTGTYPATKEAANGGAGLKKSEGTTLQYTSPYGSDNGYCLSASDATTSFYVVSTNKSPKQGACSGHNTVVLSCPSGFIQVPGNGTFGTADFCVMKYEAKNSGNNVPASVPTGSPSWNTSRTNAISLAQTACTGCHLITEAEWLTIAHNVLNVASNWSGGVVGNGYIYSGHNDLSPGNPLAASADDTDGYYGTGNSGNNQRRTLRLSNGETIWDLAGNVWEWTQGSIAAGQQPGLAGETAYAWKEYTNSSLVSGGFSSALPTYGTPVATNWGSAQGIGMLYSNRGEGAVRGVHRGGSWTEQTTAGIFTAALSIDPTGVTGGTYYGFRVAK